MTVFGVDFIRGAPAQCVAPSNVAGDKLGTGETAEIAIADAAAGNSDVAARDGVVLVSIPPSATGEGGTAAARVAIGLNATAVATDIIYPSGIYSMPIRKGWRVSVFNDGVAAGITVTVCLAH